jgi:hypothetical protein
MPVTYDSAKVIGALDLLMATSSTDDAVQLDNTGEPGATSLSSATLADDNIEATRRRKYSKIILAKDPNAFTKTCSVCLKTKAYSDDVWVYPRGTTSRERESIKNDVCAPCAVKARDSEITRECICCKKVLTLPASRWRH